MVEGVSGLLSVARRSRRQAELGAEPGPADAGPTAARRSCFRAIMPTACAGPSMISPGATSWPNGGRPRRRGTICRSALRRGPRPRALVTTTPRPMALLKRIDRRPVDGDDAADGRATISTSTRSSSRCMTATYGGTRIGAQELDGELLEDVEGALWTRELIERARVAPSPRAPLPRGERGFDRILVGVDPPAGVGEGVGCVRDRGRGFARRGCCTCSPMRACRG